MTFSLQTNYYSVAQQQQPIAVIHVAKLTTTPANSAKAPFPPSAKSPPTLPAILSTPSPGELRTYETPLSPMTPVRSRSYSSIAQYTLSVARRTQKRQQRASNSLLEKQGTKRQQSRATHIITQIYKNRWSVVPSSLPLGRTRRSVDPQPGTPSPPPRTPPKGAPERVGARAPHDAFKHVTRLPVTTR